MEALDFIDFGLDFKIFGVHFFIVFEMAFVVRIDFAIKCGLSFVGSLRFVGELIIVLIDHLRCDVFGVALKGVSEGGLRFTMGMDLAFVGVLLVVVEDVLVAVGCSFGGGDEVVVGLFLSEGGSVVFHFISKNILLIRLRANSIDFEMNIN